LVINISLQRLAVVLYPPLVKTAMAVYVLERVYEACYHGIQAESICFEECMDVARRLRDSTRSLPSRAPHLNKLKVPLRTPCIELSSKSFTVLYKFPQRTEMRQRPVDWEGRGGGRQAGEQRGWRRGQGEGKGWREREGQAAEGGGGKARTMADGGIGGGWEAQKRGRLP
jgi:hypothetical protein